MLGFAEWCEAVATIEKPAMETSNDSGDFTGYAKRMKIDKKVADQETTDETQEKYQNRVSRETNI